MTQLGSIPAPPLAAPPQAASSSSSSSSSADQYNFHHHSSFNGHSESYYKNSESNAESAAGDFNCSVASYTTLERKQIDSYSAPQGVNDITMLTSSSSSSNQHQHHHPSSQPHNPFTTYSGSVSGLLKFENALNSNDFGASFEPGTRTPSTHSGAMLQHQQQSSSSPEAASTSSAPRESPLKNMKIANVEARLEMKHLWDDFYELGTEMIVTKAGR